MTIEISTRSPADASDPLACSRRRTSRTFIATAVIAVACATWSLWPVGAVRPARSLPGRQPGATSGVNSARSVVRSSWPSAFATPLWVDPPKPVIAKVETPAPPPSLRLQLLAIVSPISSTPSHAGSAPEQRALRAILYDQDADRLITVAVGDAIGARSISAIDAEGVTISLASGAQRLELHAGPGPTQRRGGLGPSSGHSTLPHASTAAEDLAALLSRPVASPPASPVLGTPASPMSPGVLPGKRAGP